MKIYAIKDTKAGFIIRPIMHPNDAVAVRDFTNLVNNSNELNQIAMNYTDFELWHIADFDQDTGVITPCLEFLVNGSNVKKVEV